VEREPSAEGRVPNRAGASIMLLSERGSETGYPAREGAKNRFQAASPREGKKAVDSPNDPLCLERGELGVDVEEVKTSSVAW